MLVGSALGTSGTISGDIEVKFDLLFELVSS